MAGCGDCFESEARELPAPCPCRSRLQAARSPVNRKSFEPSPGAPGFSDRAPEARWKPCLDPERRAARARKSRAEAARGEDTAWKSGLWAPSALRLFDRRRMEGCCCPGISPLQFEPRA